jgi:hypothetical protein
MTHPITIRTAIKADPINEHAILTAARAVYGGDGSLSAIEQQLRSVSRDDEHVWESMVDDLRAAEDAWLLAHQERALPEGVRLTFGSWSRIMRAADANAANTAWRTTDGE